MEYLLQLNMNITNKQHLLGDILTLRFYCNL